MILLTRSVVTIGLRVIGGLCVSRICPPLSTRAGHQWTIRSKVVISSGGAYRLPAPVTRCQICRRTVAYRPASLTEVLTEHYRRAHPGALVNALPSPVTVRGDLTLISLLR